MQDGFNHFIWNLNKKKKEKNLFQSGGKKNSSKFFEKPYARLQCGI